MTNKPVALEKVLVANRGEIALRIMKTLRKMGIKSVAIYSDVDRNAQHVQYADEAFFVGDAPAAESYLSIRNIISTIRASGAQGVHPGYGFLSENPLFAQAVKREGVVWIGPNARAIKKMGDKIEAKKIAISSGVSTVPGYIGTIATVEQAIEITEQIGFPVIIKAAAGGGGRGMRVVNNTSELTKAFHSAKLEAENCFNDDRVFIEKLIEKPRHIEIQLLADKFGNAVCLGERECSIQRYHQKVIEEAPSSFVDQETREKMYKEVISLAQKVNYDSVGTVEFMMDEHKNYYFLEMNTRLQVEHPVTELITGLDLVEQMVRIAAGEPLSFTQADVQLNGWAIETRICAEDPSRGFLPSSGRILEYKEPPKTSNIRVDSGVTAGGEVSMYYDAMIAKLCSYAPTRQEAINLMSSGLGSFVIEGIAHNIPFLESLINHPRFISGDINTGFIDQEYPEGFTGGALTYEMINVFLSAAVLAFLTEAKRAASLRHQLLDQSHKISSRWVVSMDNLSFPVITKEITDGYHIRYSYGRSMIVSNWNIGSPLMIALINGEKCHVKIERITTGYRLTYLGTTVDVYIRSPRVSELEATMKVHNISDNGDQNELLAPLAGQIIATNVALGDQVTVGQELFVLTAMKMENVIKAERDGKVAKIFVQNMDNVASGQLLLEFE
jgi:propionyl-CoA carboxylase alpha chain